MLVQYKYAGKIYLIPFVFLALYFLDALTINKTGIFFISIFNLLLLPAGFLGLYFSIVGFRKSKPKYSRNWDIGYAAIILGFFIILTGLLITLATLFIISV